MRDQSFPGLTANYYSHAHDSPSTKSLSKYHRGVPVSRDEATYVFHIPSRGREVDEARFNLQNPGSAQLPSDHLSQAEYHIHLCDPRLLRPIECTVRRRITECRYIQRLSLVLIRKHPNPHSRSPMNRSRTKSRHASYSQALRDAASRGCVFRLFAKGRKRPTGAASTDPLP